MSERESIRCLTLTRLWLFSRYLYRAGEYRLWVPLNHRAAGYSLVVYGFAWVLLAVLQVPWDGLGLTLHVVAPGVMVWWALSRTGEGARPWELVWSWVRMLRPARGVRPVVVRSRALSPVRPVRVREHG